MSPGRKEKRGLGTALAITKLTAVYHVALAPQRPGRGTKRKCVACDTPVTNRSVGGHDGRPLSGQMWRQWCADCPAQLLLTFNGVGAP
jgi:hypothetical protein